MGGRLCARYIISQGWLTKDKIRLAGSRQVFDLQFIRHPESKERLVVIPETQFRILERAANIGFAAESFGRLDASAPLPQPVLDRIADGENAVRAVREWRGLTGRDLAHLVGISPSMLSQIERTGKTGSTKTFKALAEALAVPLDMIFPQSSSET